ncbi:hypothetical protein NQ024_14845, partial [Corynebacterium sp. 35RC1]|nr:hypothetical protein [Corynebacterium sp. 35RC1]
RKHPPIQPQRPPKPRMKNPPSLDVSDNPLHHRPQPIQHPIIPPLLPTQPLPRLAPGRGSQPQPDIALISHSALIKISFQAMMFEGVSIMPGPGHRVCDSQQLSIQGANDLVVESGSFVLSREICFTK